jgi:hypothetical protein
MSTICETCREPFEPRRHWGRFCSTACRVAAHRASAPVTHPALARVGLRSPKSPPRHLVPDVTLRIPGIVPDATYPGMYRVILPDGSLSDMVNLTRAKDALRVQREAVRNRGPP